MKKRALSLLVGVCVVVPAGAVSASKWEPEREYSEFAVTADDEIRYGGYNLDGSADLAFIDVLDETGRVIETLQLPTVEGWNTRLYDLVTNGDLLIAFYHLHLPGGDAFSEITDRYMLSLFDDGKELARGGWGKHPYAQYGRKVAFSGDLVFIEYSDIGLPEDPKAVIVDAIPKVVADVDEISDIEPVEWLTGNFEWGDLYLGQDMAVDISAGAEALYFYWNADYLERDPSVDVYSLGSSDPEFDHTVTLSGLDTSLTQDWSKRIVDADHGPDGSFVLSGVSPANIEWCSVWTHDSDGSLQDCFQPRLGGAEQDAEERIDPFDVDHCGGIVVADVEADAGVLTGHKFIPSNRDVGCFVDSLDSTFVSNIAVVGRSGITKGCNPPDNDRYCPKDYVTRGQMAAFLHRALNDVLSPTQSVEFIDDDGTKFEADIEWLGGVGVTRGCNPPDNDRYCPADFVTRGQMAAFLVRAIGYTDNGGGDLFIDDNGHTFENDIDKLGTAGVTRGCNPPDNNRYCPDDYVTRGQMAAFLDRALNG